MFPCHRRFVVVALALLATTSACTIMSDIAPAEARGLVARGARLVDVRSAGEFAEGHIDGALNIPVGELSSRYKEIGPPHVPVVLYCHTGVRAAAAADILVEAGFARVHNVGGLERWSE